MCRELQENLLFIKMISVKGSAIFMPEMYPGQAGSCS
jgi:hypothetical protein